MVGKAGVDDDVVAPPAPVPGWVPKPVGAAPGGKVGITVGPSKPL